MRPNGDNHANRTQKKDHPSDILKIIGKKHRTYAYRDLQLLMYYIEIRKLLVWRRLK